MMVGNEVIDPVSGPKEGKRKRAKKPKSKTGCITCRTRRVKCDENKPECHRCIKSGWRCDGFVGNPQPSKKLIKPQQVSYRPLLPYVKQSLPTILPEPCCSRFQNQEEHHFFQLFTSKTAPHLSGYLDPVLWNRIVLQVSEAEESIRHAVISIGALDMTRAPSLVASTTGKEVSERQVFALKQYSKAIKELRRNVPLKKYDLRTVLVASILIICFETYHQNHESAASQIRTTVRLIGSRGKELGSNKDIEEDLLCMFDRLDLQTMSRTDPHPDLFTIDEHKAFKYSNTALLSRIPDC